MMPWSLWRSRRPLEPWPCWPKRPGLPCGCAKWAGLWAAHLCSYKRGGEELSERCKVDGELRGWGGGLISILLGFCISWVRLARKSASFAAFTRNLTRCRLNERIRLECFLCFGSLKISHKFDKDGPKTQHAKLFEYEFNYLVSRHGFPGGGRGRNLTGSCFGMEVPVVLTGRGILLLLPDEEDRDRGSSAP